MNVTFTVLPIDKPILSVGQLARDGMVVTFTKGGGRLECGEWMFHLVPSGNLCYLPAQLSEQEQWTPRAFQVLGGVTQSQLLEMSWLILDWGGYDNNTLLRCCLQRGCGARAIPVVPGEELTQVRQLVQLIRVAPRQ